MNLLVSHTIDGTYNSNWRSVWGDWWKSSLATALFDWWCYKCTTFERYGRWMLLISSVSLWNTMMISAIQPGSIMLLQDKFQFHAAATFDCLWGTMEWTTVFLIALVQVFLPKPLPHWDKFNVWEFKWTNFDLMGFKSHDLEDIRNFSGRPRIWNHNYSVLMPRKLISEK